MEKCPSATYTAVVAILILVIASTQWQSVKGETFYIVITPGSPFCNESGSEHGHGSGADPQHCLTLQQFFTKFISKELNPTNLTLKLEPGEHILDYNLTIATVVSFAMTSEAATINCTSPVRYFELYFLKDVLISGITFMDCGLLGIFNTGNFRFENSSIYEYDYGNIYSLVVDSVTEVAIIGSAFLQNHYSGQLGIGNSSMIRIQECTFSHINAYKPVISSWDSTCLIIDSTTFENITHGTAVEITNNQESVTIKNCDFINNNIRNRSETQGLFSIDGRGSIEICGNRFIQNTGKVLSINSVNETTIDQNTFIDNAGPGAALDINAISVPLTISRNNFTRNTDGAINLLVSDSHVTVDDCNFSGNTKNENGGAAMSVYEHDYELNEWDSASLKISQSSFFNNSVIMNGSGGALHIGVDSPSSVVTINSSIFSHNRASQAGAVYINASANCTFGTILTTFDNNIATEGRAGAVATEGEPQHLVFLLNSTFTNNTAPHSCAGAVYIDDADTYTFGSTFLNNLAQTCGALALNSGCIEIKKSNFLSNRAETDGGVICTSADMTTVSISGNFSYNHAERNGGVMIIEPLTNEHYGNKSITYQIEGSAYFEHNTAGLQGGVFAIFSRSEFLVTFSSFFNNQAGIEGGVMYVRDTNSSVSIFFDSQLGFNGAAKRGGVISINGSSLFIDQDTHIFNNSADMGAVISACGSNVIFPQTLYQYNDPNFPNCLLYDEHGPSTGAVTTPTIPPTGAKHLSAGIAVAIVVPIVCFLVIAIIITAALSYAYCRKCKKSVGIGFKKLETDDPDLAPLVDNA